MTPTIGARRTTCALLVALSGVAAAQSANDSARDEAGYARLIETIADSAIHRLDFFPVRAQTRVQLLLLSSGDTVAVLFADLAHRSLAAAVVVDEMIGRFGTTHVPDDLRALHGELLSALGAARGSLDRLATASVGCQVSVASMQRCQSPLTSATTSLADAYARYLSARVKIREQIRDTNTELPEFHRPR